LYWDGWIFGTLDSRPPKIPYERYDVIVGLGYENVASADATGNRAPEEIRLAPHAWTAVIGLDVGTMGRTAPFDLGIVADPKAAMIDLLEAVQSLATKARLAQIREERFSRAAPQIAAVRQRVDRDVRAAFGRQPMHPYELAMAVEDAIDRDAITINENLSHDFSLHHGLIQRFGGDAKLRLSAGGGSLGWGVGAAIGAKLGEPNRQVVAHIGDGSLMYSAAGFWTMARYNVPVLIIVWNNRNYQTVRHGFSRFGGNMAELERYPGLHLGDPDIDFVGLAKSQGVDGERATTASEIATALERGVAATRAGSPYVIDAVISQFGGGADSDWYQEFNLAETRTRAV
jgi:benzoylformate decarboxylase